MKKLLMSIAMFLGLVGVGVVAANSLQANALYTTRNCTASAVIKCGTMNETELKTGLKNSASARALYKKLGVPQSFSGSKKGTLKVNGDIVVGGKVVAKNAQSYGRIKRPGSKATTAGGVKFYSHPAKTAFPDDTPVHVFFNKSGQFLSAIADICGNPIIATNVVPAPKPAAKCDSLTAAAINGSRTNFMFTTKVTTKNGAKITGYTYSFGDGTSKKTTAKSITHNYSKPGTYTAKVVVHTSAGDKSCLVKITVKPEPKPPVAQCDKLTAKRISRNTIEYTVQASASNGATIKNYTFDFGDGQKTTTTSTSVRHTYPEERISVELLNSHKAKVYQAKVTAHTSVGDKSGENCEAMVVIEPTPVEKMEVCNLETGQIEAISKDDYDSSKHGDINDKACNPPEKIEVCDLDNKKVITIDEKDFDSSKHSKNLSDCDEKEEPTAPVTELPQTGVDNVLAGGIGIAGLVAGLGYYIASRRAL